MAGKGFFGKATDFYVKHLGLMGLIYGLVPILVVFGTAPLWAPYRPVFWVRLALALLACFTVAPLISIYAGNLWLIKHRSPKGPISILDGGLIGAATAVGIAYLPPMTGLIDSSNIEFAKTALIITWLAAPVAGFIVGALICPVGRKHISREWPAEEKGQ